MIVLLDGGATHNLISNEVTLKTSNYQSHKQSRMVLYWILKNATKTQGVCRGIVVNLQGINIVEEFLPLDLGSTNIILGYNGFKLSGRYILIEKLTL